MDGGGAGGEVDVVAGELVGGAAQGVEEADDVGGRLQGLVDDRGGKKDAARLVDASPVGGEKRHRLVVVHLDAHVGQEVTGLVENPIDEGIVQEAEGGRHGHLA